MQNTLEAKTPFKTSTFSGFVRFKPKPIFTEVRSEYKNVTK